MKTEKTRRLVGTAILAAVVVVLQSLSSYFRFGLVELSFVLIPIVVGAAMYGAATGALLGVVFGIVVLFQPGTVPFHQITVLGTCLTVLLKGGLAGLITGLVYRLLRSKNEWIAIYLAAALCPIVNTAVFGIGLILFFSGDLIQALTIFVTVNFALELLINILCAPIIYRIIHAIQKRK